MNQIPSLYVIHTVASLHCSCSYYLRWGTALCSRRRLWKSARPSIGRGRSLHLRISTTRCVRYWGNQESVAPVVMRQGNKKYAAEILRVITLWLAPRSMDAHTGLSGSLALKGETKWRRKGILSLFLRLRFPSGRPVPPDESGRRFGRVPPVSNSESDRTGFQAIQVEES